MFSQIGEIAEGMEMQAAEKPPIGENVFKEMEEFLRFPESHEQEAVTISEGGYTASGRYIPGRVEAIDTEAAEFDPQLSELKQELETWIQQGEQMSCAVASQTMALNQLEQGPYTESEMLDVGRKHYWYSDGTYACDVGKIAAYMGMDVEQYSGVRASELTLANDPEVKVLANVDSTLLHYPDSFKRCNPDHVVQVLRVESTEQGDVVILNDPGHENGRGAVYPIEVFSKAYRGDITTIRKGGAA